MVGVQQWESKCVSRWCVPSRLSEIEKLICQDIRTPDTPKKFGKKMICLADEKSKRIEFLQWYFDQKRRVERAMKDWKEKLIPPSLPPGFFLPGGKMTASLLPFVFSL